MFHFIGPQDNKKLKLGVPQAWDSYLTFLYDHLPILGVLLLALSGTTAGLKWEFASSNEHGTIHFTLTTLNPLLQLLLLFPTHISVNEYLTPAP